jgi:hypothetical protein
VQPLENSIPFDIGVEGVTLMGEIARTTRLMNKPTLAPVMIFQDDSVDTQDMKK